MLLSIVAIMTATMAKSEETTNTKVKNYTDKFLEEGI